MITIIKKGYTTASQKNLRMTPQRRVILEALRDVTSHPTADELYEMVLRGLPRISLGTAYRNLEVLSERGIIQKLALGGAQKHFDGNARNHYHIRCTGCGRVDDVPMEAMAELEEAARAASDYEITGYCVGFIALCPECKKRGASSSGKNDSK